MAQICLGIQGPPKRSRLGVEWRPPSVQDVPPTVITTPGGTSVYAPRPQCCRRNETPGFPRMSLLGSKEGHRQEKSHSRPLYPKQTHSLPSLQDDNHPASTGYSTGKRLDNLSRLERGILPCPNRSSLQEVPGVPTEHQEISIQSPSIRTEYSPGSLHTTSKSRSGDFKRKRNLGSCLFRRLANLERYQARLYSSGTSNPRVAHQDGFPYKYREIPLGTSSKVPMAGFSLEHQKGNYIDSSQKEARDKESSEVLPVCYKSNKEISRENPGISTICLSGRPCGQDGPQVLKSPHAPTRIQTQKGLATENPSLSKRIPQKMAKIAIIGQELPLETSASLPGRSHRRVYARMGLPYFRRKRNVGSLVTNVSEISHKYSGTGHSPSSSSPSSSPERNTPQTPFRQLDSSPLSEQEGLSQVSHTQQLGDDHPGVSGEKQPVPIRISCGGSQQRDSRRPIAQNSSSIGMGLGQEIIPMVMQSGNLPSSGPFRHQGESPTPEICVSNSGSISSGEGCLHSGLESLAEDIPLSSLDANFEGFEHPPNLQGTSSPGGTKMASSGLVPSPSDQGSEIFQDPQSNPVPESWQDHLLQDLRSRSPPSRLDFIKNLLTNRFSGESVNEWQEFNRQSSRKQYEYVWKSFIGFIKTKNICTMKEETIASFLRFLFHTKRLAPSTISTYKAAIARPVFLGWNIDVTDNFFSELIKAFANIRPAVPYRPVRWSLDPVLNLLSEPEFCNFHIIENHLSKCIFLLALATGNRVSELHALRREPEYTQISKNMLTIVGRASFIAKNENPIHRRNPIFIKAIFDDDGTPHPLCPVDATRTYIELTKNVTNGPLFISLKDVPLSKFKCSYILCQIIKESQPNVFPHSHDIRKMATSLAFFANVDLDQICDSVGWSSSRVFRRHYLKQINDVVSNCVVLGNCLPNN